MANIDFTSTDDKSIPLEEKADGNYCMVFKSLTRYVKEVKRVRRITNRKAQEGIQGFVTDDVDELDKAAKELQDSYKIFSEKLVNMETVRLRLKDKESMSEDYKKQKNDEKDGLDGLLGAIPPSLLLAALFDAKKSKKEGRKRKPAEGAKNEAENKPATTNQMEDCE